MADEDISESFSEWQQIPSPSSTTSNNNTQIVAAEITTLPLTEGTIDNNNDEKGEGNKWLKKNLRELSSWVVQIASKIRKYAASKVGIGTLTCNRSRILTVVWVSLFYWMIQKKWRRQTPIDTTSKKFMLLIQEKDQKIDQLSLQISQMNESLLTRRKVPVLQTGAKRNILDDLKLSCGSLTISKFKNIQWMHARELHDLHELTIRCLESHFDDSCKEYHIWRLADCEDHFSGSTQLYAIGRNIT